MKNYCIYFFWEQEQTSLKYGKDYIVTEASAAPVYDDTERAGIAADHSQMVKFDSNRSSGFRVVAAALDKYCEEAPEAIRRRYAAAEHILLQERRREAAEKIRRMQPAGFELEAERGSTFHMIKGAEDEIPLQESAVDYAVDSCTC
jgi:hypothetical protein